ncbi:MAG: hypothetical protein ACI9LO_001285 [Planctomycetota bacterium]|jgi:hypothetical protein
MVADSIHRNLVVLASKAGKAKTAIAVGNAEAKRRLLVFFLCIVRFQSYPGLDNWRIKLITYPARQIKLALVKHQD